MPRVKITGCLEGNSKMEEHTGVRLKGVSAILDVDPDMGVSLAVMGEIWARSNGQLNQNVTLKVTVHDSDGDIIGRSENYFYAADFFQMDSFEASIDLPTDDVAKVRLYPTRG